MALLTAFLNVAATLIALSLAAGDSGGGLFSDECGSPDICCSVVAANPLLLALAPQMSAEKLNEILKTSPAFSFNPGAKVYSLASGGTNFNFQLLFARNFDSKQANVTFEIELAKNADQRVISQCRLSCQQNINRVICDVPSIRSLMPDFHEDNNRRRPRNLLALPYDSQGMCGRNYDDIPVTFCYEIKLNGYRIAFITTEAQRSNVDQALRGVVPDEVIQKLSYSLKPITIDQAVIYLPDPAVNSAVRLSQNLSLIKGFGLKSDAALDTRFSVTLTVDGVAGQVNCEPLDPSDPYYIEHREEIEWSKDGDESNILCLFKEKEFTNLAERGRGFAVNGTLLNVTVAVTAGFWRGTAIFHYKLPPAVTSRFPVEAVVVPVGFVILVAVSLIICLCVLAKGTSPKTKDLATKVRNQCPVASICLGFYKPDNEMAVREVVFSLNMFPPQIAAAIESKRLDSAVVKLHEDIGTGHFGTVKRGTLLPPLGSNRITERPVAVKFIQNCTDKKQLEEFFEEAVHMFTFDHPNVLGAYGVTYGDGGPPALVLPLMDVGDLRRFVQIGLPQITDLLIVDFAQQIAEGMAYLANKSLIHRDLAARNCLLNKFRVVKIADFGLSRLATNTDYEYVPTYEMQMLKRPMPIRWMAPECIEHGVFSEKTDIWAYGVVLWELASRGQRPYTSMETPIEVIRYVCVGKNILQKVEPISDRLYSLMNNCWNEQPSERPKFAELARMMKNLLNDPNSPLFIDIPVLRLSSPKTADSNTNLAEREVHINFLDALRAMSSPKAAYSGESHAPIPSRTSCDCEEKPTEVRFSTSTVFDEL